MSRLAQATFAAQGMEAERHEVRQRAEAMRKHGATPGYRCVHGLSYKCKACYAQPGETPYLPRTNP